MQVAKTPWRKIQWVNCTHKDWTVMTKNLLVSQVAQPRVLCLFFVLWSTSEEKSMKIRGCIQITEIRLIKEISSPTLSLSVSVGISQDEHAAFKEFWVKNVPQMDFSSMLCSFFSFLLCLLGKLCHFSTCLWRCGNLAIN